MSLNKNILFLIYLKEEELPMKYYYAQYSRYGVKTTWASDGTITGDEVQ